MHSLRKYFPHLLAIFLLSVLVRMPTLNRPLSKHHEFCTAVALRILQIWDEAGITTYRFNPVMTYPDPADKFINNYASGSRKMMDESGNYYYTSHPPFAYYLPFFVFKILGTKPDVLAIQLFNISIHFLCGIGVFLILKFLIHDVPAHYPSAPLRAANAPALLGFTAYMASPGTLWFHSNVYMADILVQLFFIYGVYFALKFFEAKNVKWLVLLAIASFLMTYTSWLGVFFCVTVLLMGIQKKDLTQAFVVAGCGAAALLLAIFQYSQIAGWNALKQEWFIRFAERSGWDLRGVIVILKNYITSYLPLLAAIPALGIFSLKETQRLLNSKLFLFIALSVIPAALLHLILSNYSGHDFTTLYGGLFLCVIFGIFIFSASQRIKGKWIVSGIAVFVVLCIAQYYYINRPGEYSLKGDRYADFQDIGKSIAAQSSNDEVIFLIGLKPSPEIIFYAGRNIRQVRDEKEAMNFLQEHNGNKGVIFEAKEENKIALQNRISLEQLR